MGIERVWCAFMASISCVSVRHEYNNNMSHVKRLKSIKKNV